MIPRKKLQLLLYVLGIFYAFGEDDADELQLQRNSHDFPQIPSLDSLEFEKTTEENGLQFLEAMEEFPKFTSEPNINNALAAEDEAETGDTYNENFFEHLVDVLHLEDKVKDGVALIELENQSDCRFSSLNSELDLKEVQNLTIHSLGTDWVFLSWNSPCKDANISMLYSISICSFVKCVTVNQTETMYNATDLDACMQYNCSIKIIYEDAESVGIEFEFATSDNITEIGDAQNLRVENTSSDTIQLKWDPPAINSYCARNYTVVYCYEEDCNTSIVTDTEFIAGNLEPCTEYVFTIVTIADAVNSSGVNISERISTPKLSEPQSAIAEPGNFSLYVHWRPPQVGPNCVKHYSVTINPITTTKITNDTAIVIDNLIACGVYNVSITAVNEDDENGNTVTLEQEVAASVTNPPQLEMDEPLVSMTSASFSWSFKKPDNYCPVSSVITVCNYTVTTGHGFEIVDGESIVPIDPSIEEDGVSVNMTVTELSPYTTYTCFAYTNNSAGLSELSEPVNITTLEDVPSAPEVNVANITDSQFVLIWESPKYLAGGLESFEMIIDTEVLFISPDWCTQKQLPRILQFNESIFSYEVSNAIPYTRYRVEIRAKTGAGWGPYSYPLTYRTDPGVPGIVSKLSCKVSENETNPNALYTTVTWGLPCALNGELEYFNISVYGTRQNYPAHLFSLKKGILNSVDQNHMFSVTLDEFKGEYNYTLTVSAKVNGVDELGTPTSRDNILYPAGVPPEPSDEYVKSITIDPYKARRSTTSAAILLPLFPDTNGDIIYYSIIISELGRNPQLSTRYDLKNNPWPNMSSWEDAMLQDFRIPYQATRPRWDPYPNYIADYGHMKAVKYVLGDDPNCKDISSNTKNRVYCNGPLKPDTWYHIRMRAFTYGGYTDSQLFTVKTNAELNVGIVIGIVFGILLLGILTTMMLLIRKWSPIVILRRFLHSDMSGSPVPTPFTRKKFIAHCQQLVDNPGKLSNEFRLLQTLSVDLQMPTNSACLQANRKKNRYSDILPYDFSRVKLEIIDNDPNTDYINASFIRGYTGEDEYIACQGPKEETTYDFWRMVDQYNVNMIVMLTQLVEKGKEKCHQYFPTIRETFRYENMTIRCTSELDFRTYTQRTFVLQKENKKRNLVHLHFKDWPDHDVPEDFDPMIHFCQIMRRNILANKGYVVIHCSAGIGRTGTLIAIDILLQHLRDNRKLDVFGTVYRLRHHRINMVQRESQYAYIYNCIKQVLKNPYCLKTYKPPPVHAACEGSSKKGINTSNTSTNLVNNSETLKKRNFFMSMDSIRTLHEILPWTNRKDHTNAMNNGKVPGYGLRYCRSTSALNSAGYPTSGDDLDPLDCLINKVLKNTTHELATNNDTKGLLEELTDFVDENSCL